MDRSALHNDELEAVTDRLVGLIERHARVEGESPSRLPGVRLYRINHKDVEWTPYAGLTPSLCLVPQGAKSSLIGKRVFQHGPARMAVYTIDGPVSGYVTQASRARPLLCFRLDLDAQRIAHHVLDVFPSGIPNTSDTSAVEVAPTDAAIVACACRMLELDLASRVRVRA
jgi:hypothetical protein